MRGRDMRAAAAISDTRCAQSVVCGITQGSAGLNGRGWLLISFLMVLSHFLRTYTYVHQDIFGLERF